MMDARCRVDLLGGLRAAQSGRVITRFRTQKTGALLGYLAYYLHRAHPREVLIAMLWPDDDLDRGRQSLSMALSSLRHQLEPPGVPAGAVVVADRFTVQLNPSLLTTDVLAFEAALRAVEQAPAAERPRHLCEAVELYRGELLPGFYEDWIVPEQQRLAELYFQALVRLTAHLEQEGEVDRALDYAQRAAGIDPLREEAHVELMRLYAAVGQFAAALRQYRELERILREELGESPLPTTRALAVEIARKVRDSVSAAAIPVSAPPPIRAKRRREPEQPPAILEPAPSTPPVSPRLPLQLTRFFGREEEIARLVEMLTPPGRRGGEGMAPLLPLSPSPPLPLSSSPLLVTLTGPGGSGKTRLAIEVAGRVAQAYGGSVWFVPLADVTDALQIAPAIADALDLPREARTDPLVQAAEYLRRQPSLLILDNFEQIVEEGAETVRKLLEGAPPLTCLVTSRHRLGLSGEREFPVLPLPVPDRSDGVVKYGSNGPSLHPSTTPLLLVQYPSVALFVDRAQAVRPDFQVTKTNARAVAELCSRLEGLPLAIELAASRAQVLTPGQMLMQVSRRFDWLVNRRKDIPERHRSLRATMEWSYRLLSPPLQRFFTRLSVFCGGWTLEAAEVISEEPLALDHLAQLMECSLVLSEERSGEMRYRMLESLREYSREQVSSEERSAIGRRHAQFYLALAELAEPHLQSQDQGVWLVKLDAEQENLRAAMEWFQNEAPGAESLRLTGALWRYWRIRGAWAEGLTRLSAALEQPSALASTRERAQALNGAGNLARSLGDRARARACLEESLSIFRALGDEQRVAGALNNLGLVYREEGHYETARQLYEEALSINRKTGHRIWEAHNYTNLALIASEQGDYVSASRLYESALATHRAMDNPLGIGNVLNNYGLMHIEVGDYAAARRCLEEALTILRELGERSDFSYVLSNLGRVAAAEGDHAAALIHYRQCLEIKREIGDRHACLTTLEFISDVACAQGKYPRATRLLGAVEALRASSGRPLLAADRARYDRKMAALREALGAEAFEIERGKGHALPWEQAVDDALEEEESDHSV